MTDLRLALRLCFRHPLLSLAAIGSLALGIGANTAIFTVLNGSVLQPLRLRRSRPADGGVGNARGQPDAARWRRRTSSTGGARRAGVQRPGRLRRFRRDADRLRRSAARARGVGVGELLRGARRAGAARPRDGRRRRSPGRAAGGGADRRVVASAVRRHRATRIGKTIILNSIPHTIVGVLPPDFDDADGQRRRSLDDRRSRHPAQLSVSGRHHRGSRFAHHRRDRPARAGRDARAGAGAAHERDGGAVAALSATPTPASAPTCGRCTRRSSATFGR